MSIRLHVWGPRACFVRPEFKLERVSYETMTPGAARGILSAIYGNPSIRWHIDRIHILKPIEIAIILRDDPEAANINRVIHPPAYAPFWYRAAQILTDVAYLIEAHLTLTEAATETETIAEHLEIFRGHAKSQELTRAPSLGLRNFPAEFALIEHSQETPASEFPPHSEPIDLGWVFHDIDRRIGGLNRFFRAVIVDGVVAVPDFDSPDLAA